MLYCPHRLTCGTNQQEHDDNIPRLVSRTVSAEFGSPSHDGVWLSPSDSVHCMNSSRLHRHITTLIAIFRHANTYVGNWTTYTQNWRHCHSTVALLTTEPTLFILPSPAIPLRLCELPMKHNHDSVTLISTLLMLIKIQHITNKGPRRGLMVTAVWPWPWIGSR